MIRYALTCKRGHAFESWFGSSKAYDELARLCAKRLELGMVAVHPATAEARRLKLTAKPFSI